MRYGSVCSGVEAATLAWETLGWTPAFFSEIEDFPSEVLKQRWPKIKNLGDFTKIKDNDYEGEIDLLTGGTPCQSFSVAGLRKGLKDTRGNLCLEFAKLAFRTGARWVVWENVPGVLSSNGGKDFAGFLSLLSGWNVEVPTIRTKKSGEKVRRWRNSGIISPAPGCFGLAWRVLDAQYVRVDGYPRALPQRRRRVFVVGYLGDWIRSAAVLFDRESLSGNPAPGRKARTGIARSLTASTGGASAKEQQLTFVGKDGALNPLCMAHGQGGAEINGNYAPTLNCNHEAPVLCLNNRPQEFKVQVGLAHTLRATDYKQQPVISYETGRGFWQQDAISGTVKVNGAEPTTVVCYENHPADSRVKEAGNMSPTLSARAGTGGGNLPFIQSYGIAENVIGRQPENGGNGAGVQKELQYTLNATGVHGVSFRSSVRRLLPVECERLMGQPDGHTLIKWKGKDLDNCPDGHRYKACGNSQCVNVMRWIGQRIDYIDKEFSE